MAAAKDRARGKSFERWVAGRLGWRRRTHGERGGFDDVVLVEGGLAPVSIECKAYAVLQLRTADINQAKRNAAGRPWALVQRPRGWRSPVVTIDWFFFEALLRGAGFITNHEEEVDDGAEGTENRPGGTDPPRS